MDVITMVLLGWVLCSVMSYGMVLSQVREGFTEEENMIYASKDRFFVIFLSLFGPLSLAAAISRVFTGKEALGFQWK